MLSQKWGQLRGIDVVSFGVSNVSASEEDQQLIKEIQRNAAFRNPTMAAAHLVGAQAEAMQAAAANEGGMGAALGFMGMNMAGQAGGMNAGNLYAMGQQQGAQASAAAAGSWTCECGTVNEGKFCSDCGKAKPAAAAWTCSCGHAGNTGKFCSECGKPRPAGPWTCGCGAVNEGRFCSECGKPRP